MVTVLWLLLLQGSIGAFDTLYYHEWRARLAANAPHTAPELRLHAVRAFLYAVLFSTLPWLDWHGYLVIVLVVILAAEVVITLMDFVVEISARKPLGDVYAGERVTHAIMGIVYGAMMAYLLPVLRDWWSVPTSFAQRDSAAPEWLRWALLSMAIGVFLSGARDMYAALELPNGGWPWHNAWTRVPDESSDRRR